MVPGHILTGPVAVSSDGPGLAADLRVTQAANGSKGIHCNAPERLHEDITDDYNNMIYADTPQEIQKRRKNFLRKWRLRHPAVANSLEEAGGRLFIFTTLSPSHVVSTGALV